MSAAPTPEQFRAHFPGLTDTVHLASCSQGALSDALAAQLLEFQHTMREHGAPWGLWMTKVADARTLFAASINASPDEVAVVPSASEGAFQVASTQDWRKRAGLVTTDLEFPSVAHVWLAQRAYGAEVSYVTDHDGLVDAGDYAPFVTDRCGLVSVPLVSYRNGLRFPVADIAERAHAVGARVFVDAYQGTGVEPADVRALDCDYLVSGSLKYLLGIPGIAFLYVRSGLADGRDPSLTGWFGRRDPFGFDPRALDFPAHARRLEIGTPSIPSAYGAVAGLRMLQPLDPHVVAGHVARLTASLTEQLLADGEVLRSPLDAARRGPMVALRDQDPEALSRILAARRIVASPRGEVIRLSLHYYNLDSDVSAVVEAVRDYRRVH
ncbi:MAG: aminotransferase class V-fold PLP-dependent enzyme [Nocardioidaceae bacterium]